MMHNGDLDEAERYFRKARAPDWHRWMKGILLLMKAGRAGDHQETFIDLAIDELGSARAQLGDDFYQTEIQLAMAAAHRRKAALLSGKASAAPEPARGRIERNAARNTSSSQLALGNFRSAFGHWTTSQQATAALRFRDNADIAHWNRVITELWPET
jgi:hypothetical protein